MIGWRHFYHLSIDHLVDPDSYMRLLRIRQGLHAGHLVNSVHRDDDGVPLTIEWSRLYDAILLGIFFVLHHFWRFSQAIKISGLVLGSLSVGLIGPALAFAVQNYPGVKFSKQHSLISVILLAISPEFVASTPFGSITYHAFGYLALSLTSGLLFKSLKNAKYSSIIFPVSSIISLWATADNFPFIFILWTVFVFDKIQSNFIKGISVAAFTAFFFTVAIVFIDPPHCGYLCLESDRISLLFAFLPLYVFINSIILSHSTRNTKNNFIVYLSFLITVMIWFIEFYHVFQWIFVKSQIYGKFFSLLSETFYNYSILSVFFIYGLTTLLIFFLLSEFYQKEFRNKEEIHDRIIVFVVAVAVCGFSTLWPIYGVMPSIFNSIALPVLIKEKKEDISQKRKITVIVLLGIALFLIYMTGATPAGASQTKAYNRSASCSLSQINQLVQAAAGQNVLVPLNEAPALLYLTKIKVTGSLYQHGAWFADATADAWQAGHGTPRAPSSGTTPPVVVTETGARFVLFCPGLASISHSPSADDLWDRLAKGNVPQWLRLAGGPDPSGWTLYRIVFP